MVGRDIGISTAWEGGITVVRVEEVLIPREGGIATVLVEGILTERVEGTPVAREAILVEWDKGTLVAYVSGTSTVFMEIKFGLYSCGWCGIA